MIDGSAALGENSIDGARTNSIPFEAERDPKDMRPGKSCPDMITDALLSSRDGMLTGKSICSYIVEKYPYFTDKFESLRTNVRHTLSRDRRFHCGPKANESETALKAEVKEEPEEIEDPATNHQKV